MHSMRSCSLLRPRWTHCLLLAQVAREIEIHAATVHPAAIKLYAAFEDAEGTYLVQVMRCCVACWVAGAWMWRTCTPSALCPAFALTSELSAACCHPTAVLLPSSWGACSHAPNNQAGTRQDPVPVSCCCQYAGLCR